MELKVQVPFQQLLTIVKTLTPTQKAKLREELKEEKTKSISQQNFIDFLLTGPVYADQDLQIIEENKKSISKWRTKN